MRYPRIAWQLRRGQVPASMHTAGHMEYIWDVCQECWCFHRKGVRSRSGRWFQVFEQAGHHLPYFEALALILEYIGIHEGWVEVLGSSEATSGAANRLAAALDGGAGADAQSGQDSRRTPVAASNAAAETLMRKCANYKHMAFEIVTNASLHSLWSALQVLIGPCMHEHNLTIIKQKTMEGSANWLKDMASGKYLGYLRETLDLLGHHDMLVASGLKAHSIDSGFALLPLNDAKAIGATLFMFVVKLLGTELLWLRRYNHSPLCVLALHDDESSGRGCGRGARQEFAEGRTEGHAMASECLAPRNDDWVGRGRVQVGPGRHRRGDPCLLPHCPKHENG